MKTLKSLFGLFFLITLTINNAKAVISIPGQTEISKRHVANQSICVKAILLNGELVPFYDLPVVEIFGNRFKSQNEIGKHKTETAVLTTDLPTIEISADRITGQQMFSYIDEGERIFMASLPEINIISDIPAESSLSKTIAGIQVINLPVITIIGESFTNPGLNAKILGMVEIDANKILATGQSEFVALLVNYDKSNILNENTDWFYITLKKCGINPTGNEVCEIISQAKIHTAALIENRVNRMIFKN